MSQLETGANQQSNIRKKREQAKRQLSTRPRADDNGIHDVGCPLAACITSFRPDTPAPQFSSVLISLGAIA
jgi:hypothetical protein